MTYFYVREDELSAQTEVTYGTKPGSPAAADFFKHTSSRINISRVTEQYYRDRDRDFQQASVKNVQIGRQKVNFGLDADLIPSGVSGTPTAPDIKRLLTALMGKATTLTAHTTLTAGSTTTVLVLTAGGGAASGIRTGGGDIIVVDVDAANGLEARRVVSRATDTVTVDRALSAAPATGRAVYVGTTYQLDITQLPSLYFWLWNGILKYAYPGVILNEGQLNVNFGDRVPVAKCSFKGEGMPEIANTDSRPTPTTAGNPLVPTIGKAWFGATKLHTAAGAGFITAMLSIKNGLELRDKESGALYPVGVKRTGNNSRYVVEQTIETFFTDAMQTFYDAAKTLTAIDTLIQLGVAVGNIVVWSCPKWQPVGDDADQDGELGLKLSGRALGTAGDDETSIAFI
jgi:hypothetical protein